MNWDESKASKAEENSDQSRHGRWCVFVPLSDTEGVKLYHSKEIRDGAMELQAYAASWGMGPKVGEACEMPRIDSWTGPDKWPMELNTVYGFITEIIDTTFPKGEDMELFERLCEKFGISTKDICGLNAGFSLVDGLPLRYDFDPRFYHGNSDYS